MLSSKHVLPVILPLGVVQAYITANANIYGCVYYAEAPVRNITVDIQAGISGTQCMHDKGNSVSLTVSNGGSTCTLMGYVENQPYDHGTDNCAFRPSYWGVSYNTSNFESGSTSSYWSANYKGRDECEVNLRDQSNGTFLCGSSNLCSNTQYTWSYNNTPTYFLIFQPEYAGQAPTLVQELPPYDDHDIEQI